ncbi:MAG: hypothetical protein ACOYCD_08055 [Kiritimatiellia bacterium]
MKNVTLRMDEKLLRQAQHIAVDRGQSLSAWMTAQLREAVNRNSGFAAARRRALARLHTGLHLGGTPLSREATHERNFR